MALGVDPARESQAHQLHVSRNFTPVRPPAEHDRTDLDRAHAAGQVQRQRERPGRVLAARDVGQHVQGVNIDGMAAGGQHDRHAGRGQLLPQVFDRADAVAQVVLIQRFKQPDGDGFEIISGQPAVGHKALGQDQLVLAGLGQIVVIEGQETADIGHAVLLGAHRAAVGVRKHFLGDLERGPVGVTRFALLDEPGVLCKAAGIQDQRNAVGTAELAGGAEIGH